jgi:hypothetical protein
MKSILIMFSFTASGICLRELLVNSQGFPFEVLIVILIVSVGLGCVNLSALKKPIMVKSEIKPVFNNLRRYRAYCCLSGLEVSPLVQERKEKFKYDILKSLNSQKKLLPEREFNHFKFVFEKIQCFDDRELVRLAHFLVLNKNS